MTHDSDGRPDGKILVQVDPDLADLIPGFLANRRKDVTAMQTALEGGDFETVRVLGHSMKGVGSGYGFDTITEIGGALERAAQNADPDGIRQQIGDLSAYLDRVEVMYDEQGETRDPVRGSPCGDTIIRRQTERHESKGGNRGDNTGGRRRADDL